MQLVEGGEAGQLDHPLQRLLAQQREGVGEERRAADGAGGHRRGVARHGGQRDRPALQGHLAHRPLAEGEAVTQRVALGVHVGAEQQQALLLLLEDVADAAPRPQVAADHPHRAVGQPARVQITGERPVELADAVLQPAVALIALAVLAQHAGHVVERAAETVLLREQLDAAAEVPLGDVVGAAGQGLHVAEQTVGGVEHLADLVVGRVVDALAYHLAAAEPLQLAGDELQRPHQPAHVEARDQQHQQQHRRQQHEEGVLEGAQTGQHPPFVDHAHQGPVAFAVGGIGVDAPMADDGARLEQGVLLGGGDALVQRAEVVAETGGVAQQVAEGAPRLGVEEVVAGVVDEVEGVGRLPLHGGADEVEEAVGEDVEHHYAVAHAVGADHRLGVADHRGVGLLDAAVFAVEIERRDVDLALGQGERPLEVVLVAPILERPAGLEAHRAGVAVEARLDPLHPLVVQVACLVVVVARADEVAEGVAGHRLPVVALALVAHVAPVDVALDGVVVTEKAQVVGDAGEELLDLLGDLLHPIGDQPGAALAVGVGGVAVAVPADHRHRDQGDQVEEDGELGADAQASESDPLQRVARHGGSLTTSGSAATCG